MPNYITDLVVSLYGPEEHEYQTQGYTKIAVNLNKGSGGNTAYLWYKKGSTAKPITRVQSTFNDEMAGGLIKAKYHKIDKNLNAGAGGDQIYLWFFTGNTEYDTPIVDIDITSDAESEAQKFKQGWEKLGCDLNRNAKGNWIYTWVKREKQTYICDVTATATNSSGSDEGRFNKGYIRLDEVTNRGSGKAFGFIWYRQTTNPQGAISDLQVSTNRAEYESYEQQDYKKVDVNLNEGTCGNPVYLWYKQDNEHKPIKAITLLLNQEAVPAYEEEGARVIKKNLNSGNPGWVECLCVYQ